MTTTRKWRVWSVQKIFQRDVRELKYKLKKIDGKEWRRWWFIAEDYKNTWSNDYIIMVNEALKIIKYWI